MRLISFNSKKGAKVMPVGIQRRDYSTDISIQHVKNPVSITGDETISIRVLDEIVKFYNEDELAQAIEQTTWVAALALQSMSASLSKYQGLKTLILNAQLLIVVPNKVNEQQGSTLITKTITLGLNEEINTAFIGNVALAALQEQNRVEINQLAIAQLSMDALDKTIEKYKPPVLSSSERQPLLTQKISITPRRLELNCCDCDMMEDSDWKRYIPVGVGAGGIAFGIYTFASNPFSYSVIVGAVSAGLGAFCCMIPSISACASKC